MKNDISVTIPNESLEKITHSINTIANELPFLLNLPENDRVGGFRLGDKNLAFLSKSKDYMNQKPEFMPSYVEIEEVTKDAVLADQLTSIQRKLTVLADRISDTANIAGMEALTGALAYYNSVKEAARNNADGASTVYDDLKQRFPHGRKSKEE